MFRVSAKLCCLLLQVRAGEIAWGLNDPFPFLESALQQQLGLETFLTDYVPLEIAAVPQSMGGLAAMPDQGAVQPAVVQMAECEAQNAKYTGVKPFHIT